MGHRFKTYWLERMMELKRLQNVNPYIVMLNKVINKTAPDPSIDFIGSNYKLTPELDDRHYSKAQVVKHLMDKITDHQLEVARLITKITEAYTVALNEDLFQWEREVPDFPTKEAAND